jgi:hypothetical protein
MVQTQVDTPYDSRQGLSSEELRVVCVPTSVSEAPFSLMASVFLVAFDGVLASLPSQPALDGIPSCHKQRVG